MKLEQIKKFIESLLSARARVTNYENAIEEFKASENDLFSWKNDLEATKLLIGTLKSRQNTHSAQTERKHAEATLAELEKKIGNKEIEIKKEKLNLQSSPLSWTNISVAKKPTTCRLKN